MQHGFCILKHITAIERERVQEKHRKLGKIRTKRSKIYIFLHIKETKTELIENIPQRMILQQKNDSSAR